MKTNLFKLNAVGLALAIGLTIFATGCGKSVQQKAYELAVEKEQQLTSENAATIVAEYKAVITLHPGTEWARKAQARADAMEAKTKTEELHKSVFQEHGVD
jgi:outer membrane protein assembly factor BamD (BamD/ComL family)